MTTTQQIQEQEKIAMDLQIDRLNVTAKIDELTREREEIDRNIKRAEVNIYSLKALETVKL
ncbi:MAG: hypothetical protein WC055_01915 [Melioribacteraceae bacterium]